jgi:NAD(P)-dependent dehydrogenase (short-subunit alcohol dehydrogenase family)
MSELSKEVCLVTGAGTGIGAGIAERFARAGARVAACGRREAPLKDTVEKINRQGGEAMAVPGDVSKEADVDHLLVEIERAYGPISILVNNAGVPGGGEIHKHSIETWDRVIAINLRGPFLLSRAVLPAMRAAGHGHILNISSEAGLEHYSGSGAYGVSKHALNALSEFIQTENQDFGIRVDTICPGMVVTEMSRGSEGLNEALCLLPEDIADLAHFLVTRRPNIKFGTPVLIQTMENPWRG